MGRPPIDEQGRAVGERDVGRTTFDHAAVGELARRFSTVPPDGLAASGVVVVGPDQELQALTAELEVRSELVDGAVASFRSPQGGGVEVEHDHHWSAVDPVPMEVLHRRARVAQRGVPDQHSRARRPGFGRLLPGEHHHAPAELARRFRNHGAG